MNGQSLMALYQEQVLQGKSEAVILKTVGRDCKSRSGCHFVMSILFSSNSVCSTWHFFPSCLNYRSESPLPLIAPVTMHSSSPLSSDYNNTTNPLGRRNYFEGALCRE